MVGPGWVYLALFLAVILLSPMLTTSGNTPVTPESGMQKAYAETFPGVNGKIVFDRQVARASGWSVYVLNADGTGQTAISPITGDGTYPSISPDGQKVVFNLQVPSTGKGELYTVNIDGTGLTKISNDVNSNHAASFSPDGKKIAFARQEGDFMVSVYTMNLDGTNMIRVSDGTLYSRPLMVT